MLGSVTITLVSPACYIKKKATYKEVKPRRREVMTEENQMRRKFPFYPEQSWDNS